MEQTCNQTRAYLNRLLDLEPVHCPEMMHYAHSRPTLDQSEWDALDQHLQRVSRLAAEFAPQALKSLAATAGRWHDAGKYQTAFQRYIAANTETSNRDTASPRSVPHSAAGAALAYARFGDNDPRAHSLALVIEAHHGALKALHQIESATRQRGVPLLEDSRQGGLPPELEAQDLQYACMPSALAIRILFSALVDADLLDTEEWSLRQPRAKYHEAMPVLLERLTAACEAKMESASAGIKSTREQALHAMRRHVFDACWEAADRNPGAFTLTVPTGGGKTLSGMIFALRHAVLRGMRRVIVVAPYTSILEQTAEVYRQALGAENFIEHHSNLSPVHDTDRNRQATENWDAPVIVTTSVQLLESLHAAHKRPCRKLHRVAGSVILLDEVQTFPPELLQAIHASFRRLVEGFGCTIVHGTATQPLLAADTAVIKNLVTATEIIPEPRRLFEAVRGRFRMERLRDLSKPLPLVDLARAVGQHQSALAIVHGRKDAVELAELLGGDCLHLSALMCAEHRSEVFAEVRRRLQEQSPCLLVSTQLIEAGVDVDFPVVFRALAGLETLAQAAGRCNREMRLDAPGRFFVYRAESQPPCGSPRLSMQRAESVFMDGDPDLNDPAIFPRFIRSVLRLMDTDPQGLIGLEREWDFPAVAEKFRMIDEATISVVCPYGQAFKQVMAVRAYASRESFRALQRFTVGLHESAFQELYKLGALEPVFAADRKAAPLETLWTVREEVHGVYHSRFGFAGKFAVMEPLIG